MSVWKYVKVHGTWHYKAAIEDKGKIIPNMVRVDGKVEFHEEGTYYFRSGRQWIKLERHADEHTGSARTSTGARSVQRYSKQNGPPAVNRRPEMQLQQGLEAQMHTKLQHPGEPRPNTPIPFGTVGLSARASSGAYC